MTSEEEVKFLRRAIRKLIFSNLKKGHPHLEICLQMGIYTIKSNFDYDTSMSEVVDYFYKETLKLEKINE